MRGAGILDFLIFVFALVKRGFQLEIVRYLFRGLFRLISAENRQRATPTQQKRTASRVLLGLALACCAQRFKQDEEFHSISSAACGELAEEDERVRRTAWRGNNIEVCVFFTTPRCKQYHKVTPLTFDL